MYLKQEDDEMKKVGFTIEFGKMEDEKERGENFVSGIEARLSFNLKFTRNSLKLN